VRQVVAGFPKDKDRTEMLRLAIAEEPRFRLDAAETRTSDPTFSISMLNRLRAELGAERPLVMILGMDSFLSLAAWRSWTELFALTHFAVGERPGFRLSSQTMPRELADEYGRRAADADAVRSTPGGAIVTFPMTALDISATALREQLARGASARYLLPETVLAYIRAHRLYR